MADSALKGVFREFAASYSVETGATTTDEHGNTVPVVTTGELVVNFEAYQFAQLVFMEGADPGVIRGRGSCISPAVMPSALHPGADLSITWRGRSGTLRLITINPDALEVLDSVLGTEFIGEIRFP